MDLLKERIIKDGKVLEGNVLQVSSFLNHMVDTALLYEIGKEFASVFGPQKPTKIMTVEASGIPFAAFCAYELQIPFIIAKKHSSTNLPENFYSAEVYSYTKRASANIRVSKDFILSEDKVVILDDFLAFGSAVDGLISIIEEANATLLGVGICIEKSFQDGAANLASKNINVHSLVRIKSLENGIVSFMD